MRWIYLILILFELLTFWGPSMQCGEEWAMKGAKKRIIILTFTNYFTNLLSIACMSLDWWYYHLLACYDRPKSKVKLDIITFCVPFWWLWSTTHAFLVAVANNETTMLFVCVCVCLCVLSNGNSWMSIKMMIKSSKGQRVLKNS